MGRDLPERTIVEFIANDFASAWDAIAHLPGPLPRGNFLFAKQAMVLLEVACRLCTSDSSEQALKDLGAALQSREARYFTELPGPCWEPRSSTTKPAEFRLPSTTKNPSHELLAALFDTIRNGQAHQYQQIRVELTDGKCFQVSLTGAEHGAYLRETFANGRPSSHLRLIVDQGGDLWLTVLPQVLFLDIRDSMQEARLVDRGLTLSYLSRKGAGGNYSFESSALCCALRAEGH
jgi:hypothetical protein